MIKMLLVLLNLYSCCSATYYSQCGQDQYLNESLFQETRNGVFVDIGAHDGITGSNTYFFEKELDWSGICIEPIPEVFKRLQKNRKCCCINGCISVEDNVVKDFCRISGYFEMLSGIIDKYDPRHLEHIQRLVDGSEHNSMKVIQVNCFNLNRILVENGLHHIDLLTIDTEGGELEILQDLDFSKFQIDVIVVEDNFGDRKFMPLLEGKGYEYVQNSNQDLIFVHKGFKK